MRTLLAVLLGLSCMALSLASQQKPALRIVVIEGEDAVNVISQKTAVAPVVEVRDRNDLPVAGVPVTFTMTGAKTAGFSGGAQAVTVTTNAAGRAAASGFTPLANGTVRIQVSATLQEQTASATITQTNVAAAAATGGGLSGVAIGLIAGGLGAGGALVAIGQGDSSGTPSATSSPSGTTSSPPPGTPPAGTSPSPAPPANRAPAVQAPTFSVPSTIVGVPVRFEASATDADGDALSYSWDFGDGNTSTQPTPTHTFQRGGAFMVRVTVRDAAGSGQAEAPITVKSMTGVWHVGIGVFSDPRGGLTLSQSGTAVVGTLHAIDTLGTGAVVHCPTSGTVNATIPHVTLTMPRCPAPGGSSFLSIQHFLELQDADTFGGRTVTEGNLQSGGGLQWKRQ